MRRTAKFFEKRGIANVYLNTHTTSMKKRLHAYTHTHSHTHATHWVSLNVGSKEQRRDIGIPNAHKTFQFKTHFNPFKTRPHSLAHFFVMKSASASPNHSVTMAILSSPSTGGRLSRSFLFRPDLVVRGEIVGGALDPRRTRMRNIHA